MDYHYAKERDPAVTGFFGEEVMKAFTDWNGKVMAPGELDRKTKEFVAVACVYMTRCPYRIEGHAKAAVKAGASKEELAEVIQIAMALAASERIAHRNFDRRLAIPVKDSLASVGLTPAAQITRLPSGGT